MIPFSIVLISLGFSASIYLIAKNWIKPKNRIYWGILPLFVTPLVTAVVMIAGHGFGD